MMKDRKGQTLFMVALGTFLFMVILSLIIDLSRQYFGRQRLHNHCDAAALAGCQLLPGSAPSAKTDAKTYYQDNVKDDYSNPTITWVSDNGNTSQYTIGGDTVWITTPYTDDIVAARGVLPENAIEVRSQRTITFYIASIFGMKFSTVQSRAVAVMCFTSGIDSSGCVSGQGTDVNVDYTCPFGAPDPKYVTRAEFNDILVSATHCGAVGSSGDTDFVVGHEYIIKGENYSNSAPGFKGILDLDSATDCNGATATEPGKGWQDGIAHGFTGKLGVDYTASVVTGDHSGPCRNAVEEHLANIGKMFQIVLFKSNTGDGNNQKFVVSRLACFEYISQDSNNVYAKFISAGSACGSSTGGGSSGGDEGGDDHNSGNDHNVWGGDHSGSGGDDHSGGSCDDHSGGSDHNGSSWDHGGDGHNGGGGGGGDDGGGGDGGDNGSGNGGGGSGTQKPVLLE